MEDKLKALGKMEAGIALHEISADLGIPYPKLLKWRKELKEHKENGTIMDVVNADEVVVHAVAEQVKQDLIDLDPDSKDIIEADINEVVKSIDNLSVLSTRLQTSAMQLANQISQISVLCTDPKEMSFLAKALCDMQEAFFNKPVTNINVQTNNYSGEGVSKFKSLMKP